MYGSPNSCCDGNDGFGLPPIVLCGVINGSYLICLCMRVCSGNLSWQYVNSRSWTVRVGEDVIGVCVWFEALIMHRMSGLSLA